MTVERIFIVGAGTMGSGIAQVAATSGFQVRLMDVLQDQLELAQSKIAYSVDKLFSKDVINTE